MSLQARVNPLDFMQARTDSFSPRPGRGMGHLDLTEEQKAKMVAPLLKRPDLDGSGPGMITAREVREADERQRMAERTRTAIKFRENMAQGIPNTGGFDASDLLKKPERAQDSTRDQAEKVSEPYREANMMAAEKTNPMNAESQDPGKQFLDYYIQGPMPFIKDPGQQILIPRRK